jgi:hypothetical protein
MGMHSGWLTAHFDTCLDQRVLRMQSFRGMIGLVFGIWMTSNCLLIYFNFFVLRYDQEWLWHMVAGFLFLDGSGYTISWLVLPLLRLEWDVIVTYNYGSTTLACLYHALCDGCSRIGGNANLRGSTYLLQIWMWECFPVARSYHHETPVCTHLLLFIMHILY